MDGNGTSDCGAACKCIIVVGAAILLALLASHLLTRRRQHQQQTELMDAITGTSHDDVETDS